MPRRDVITAGDLQRSNALDENDKDVQLILHIINLLAEVCAPFRAKAEGQADSALMAALVTFAGGVFGEGQHCFDLPDMTEGAMRSFLLTNFRSGIAAGRMKCERLEAESQSEPS